MPIYDYKCSDCEYETEIIQSIETSNSQNKIELKTLKKF